MKKVSPVLFMSALAVVLNLSCNKPETKPAEVDPYVFSSDMQSSKDIAFASMVISDIDVLCGFAGEAVFFPKFYLPAATVTGTLTTARDTVMKYTVYSYNNTLCVDGKVRNGSIFMNYAGTTPNSNYYRDFGFEGRVYLSNYAVDGWRIQTEIGAYLKITNTVPNNYNPATTNLSWQLTGKLNFINPTDSTRNLTWDGTLIKTLVNTSDPMVFNPNKKSTIQWPLAVINYKGTASGFTANNVPYTCTIGDSPVKRDFNCNFIPPNTSGITEFHPFISGKTIFNSSNFHPRTIDFGPQEPGLCDFKGVISFKDESHDVDFY